MRDPEMMTAANTRSLIIAIMHCMLHSLDRELMC